MAIKTTDLSRKEREFFQQRTEVLEAALALFAQKGFHRVTMQQIARRAEFSVGKLYKFFANKSELYDCLLEQTAEAFERRLTSALALGEDSMETLRACLTARIEVWTENIAAISLYMTETQGSQFGPHANLETKFKVQYQGSLRRVAEVFQRGMEAGLFRQGDPYLYTLALDGITQNLLLAWMEHPSEPVVEADQVLDLLVRGIGRQGG
ncbi:MAG: TetR/AcrR family transcriptional regulator [Desulfobacterales bacterium]|nr:TetR/AcrR family transcriptional regulator [Desulfobacterales bacterium]